MSGWDGMIGALESFAAPPATVEFNPTTVSLFGSDFDPFSANAILFLDSDGGVRKRNEVNGSATTTDVGVWSSEHPNETDGADYEVSIEYVSGGTPYDGFQTLGTYYTLDANLQYNFSRSTNGVTNAEYLIRIRDVATETEINTLTVSVSLERGAP